MEELFPRPKQKYTFEQGTYDVIDSTETEDTQHNDNTT